MKNKDRGIYDFKIDSGKRYFKHKKISIALTAIVVLVSITSVVPAIKNKINIANSVEATQKDSNLNKKGYVSEEIYDEKYKRYVDNEFKFYCAIPKTYTVGESIGSGNRVVLVSTDAKTKLFVGAVPNKLNLNAKELMKQYTAEFGDNVDYKASGDNWYAVSKTNEGVFHYRKCFVDNNLILWFEFNVKADSEEPIKDYIEYIESNFRLFK